MGILTARRVVVLLVVAMAFYWLVLGQYGVLLIAEGRPVAVALGVGVLLLPLVGLWVVWSELRFGLATERLARLLEAEGGLPVDDLPRLPSGRIEPEAVQAAFERRKAEVEAAPEDWRAWYRLAVAYADARDMGHARQAMRRAISLHRELNRSSGA
ncbi:hypothetical protein LI90_1362 [Carbonactinospora thermoautotrophica]|uniref:Tetratricopeptide repeat protein n=1 Tax=Carbonactinospora thermoautotrophica TaxID=1469144 RepID=A0A132MPL3_9ACTN|nr:hypothetical protein [Carbonactinospora thermoautotrophica]KWW99723.1 hypothetical protein LI90_1362 [Carbonactinospora thermoautotrophica]